MVMIKLHDDVFEVECPYCSSKSFKYKQTDGRWMFLCHHCQRNLSVEKVKNGNISNSTGSNGDSHKVQINFNSLLDYCSLVGDLPDGHPCKQYVRDRGIDSSCDHNLYFTENFSKICESVGKNVVGDRRLVLPFFNEEGDLFALQGRSLDDEGPRYLTLIFDDDEEVLFGRNTADLTKPFVVVEGPIDSLFLENGVAMAGSKGINIVHKDKAIVCLDNEPRNAQIVQKMRRFLKEGWKVVIWPDKIKQKDINDMVLKNVDVNTIIEENVHHGLAGIITLENWKKVNG